MQNFAARTLPWVCVFLTACLSFTKPLGQENTTWITPSAQGVFNLKNVTVGLIETETGSGSCFPIQRIKTGGKLRFLTARHVVVDDSNLTYNSVTSILEPRLRPIEGITLYRVNILVAEIPGNRVTVVTMNKELDTALLEADCKGVFPIMELSKDSPRIGDPVLSYGSPGGLPSPTFSMGVVTRPDTVRRAKNGWVANAPVYLGVSGGPLVSPVTNRIVGISSAVLKDTRTGQVITYVQYFIDAAAIRDWLNKGGYYE